MFCLAQWGFNPPTPDAQRNALGAVRSQVSWVQNSTRTASSYGEHGSEYVWQAFQGLRQAYGALTQTLTPQQLNQGANSLAELSAGLDIIQEVFANYEQDVASGRPVGVALADLGQVMRQASNLWLQELNKTASRLRIGW